MVVLLCFLFEALEGLLLEGLQALPSGVDGLVRAAARALVQVLATLGAEALAVGAAQRLHRKRHLHPLLRDGGERNRRIVVEEGVEVVAVELDLFGPLRTTGV